MLLSTFLGSSFVTACSGGGAMSKEVNAPSTLQVTSDAFTDGQPIPPEYTCDGANMSPPLKWSGAPPGTKAFVVICEDQDASIGVFLHWVVFNIPVADTSLAERQPKDQALASRAMQGMTDFDSVGYGGPCPPIGKHRYFFHVYALDTPLEARPGANRDEIEKAMKGHILAQGQLMGTYKKR